MPGQNRLPTFVKPLAKPLLFLAFMMVGWTATHAGEVPRGLAVRLDPAQTATLAAAAKANGVELVAGDLPQLDAQTRLVVLEAGGAELSADDLQRLGSWVQQGGGLLLALSKNTGNVAFQLAFLSPTTSWHTEMRNGSRGTTYGTVVAAEADHEFFPEGAPRGLTLPFHYEVRPWHAVERGEGRYERFARNVPFLNLAQRPGDTFWTRPLLNRDWTVRLRGDEASQTPLLLTGRYGAGRVAVFASSAHDIDASEGAAALWNPALRWLLQARPAARVDPALKITPAVAVDKAVRKLVVTLNNPTAAPVSLQAVLRLLTWEQALAGDASREVTVPPGAKAAVAFDLPAPGSTSYQALEFRDAYEARLGVLSGDGSTLLAESRLPVDLRPALTLDVATDNLRTLPYPFDAPGYDAQAGSFPFRQGLPVMAYAYPPGRKVNVAVKIANGIGNIAPLARVTDETNPTGNTAALTDGAVNGGRGPNLDGVMADPIWKGTAGRENVLTFAFPTPVRIAGVTLNGAPDDLHKALANNPSSVIVELDGREVARADNLKERFVAEGGLVSLNFPLTSASVLRLRLPASPAQPILNEVEIAGSAAELPPPAHGTLTMTLRHSLSGKTTPVAAQELTIAPGTAQALQYAVELPPNDGGADFYRVEAAFAGQTAGAPVLQIQPEHPLKPADLVRPANAPGLGFSVATGFRTVIDLDTGARDSGNSGGRTSADTLIWAYEHNLKQVGAGARTEIGRLYSSEGNTQYMTTPWRSFSDGEPFYEVATPIFIEKMKQQKSWPTSEIVMLNHGDRWDSGPAVDTLNGWQDFIGFDDYLRSKGQPGLQGKTRREVAQEIHEQHESYWQEWNLERYASSIRTLHDSFQKEGKDVIIQGQGMPFVPPGFDKPPLTEVIRGLSQDSTWEMGDESVPYTTGFQMAVKAYDPGFKFSTQFVWGFDSAVLNNPRWHVAVSTTEPSRRHLYDKAFRGAISNEGVYQSMHTYGYNMNAGVSYVMSTNDWQESWRTQERNSLLTPDGPLGVGLIVGVERYTDPAHALFNGGGMGDDWDHNPAKQHMLALANVGRYLQAAGLPIPFAANAMTVAKWGKVTPLLILDLDTLTDKEVEGLRALHQQGAHLAAFQGTDKLSEAAARLFGVNQDGGLAAGHPVGELAGRPVVAGENTLFIPLPSRGLNAESVRVLGPLLKASLQPRVQFPPGTSGYGFTSNRRAFVVVEDWREEGRVATLRYRASAGVATVRAVDVNDHRPLAAHRENNDWLIEVPLRPGDGVLVGIDEAPPSGH